MQYPGQSSPSPRNPRSKGRGEINSNQGQPAPQRRKMAETSYNNISGHMPAYFSVSQNSSGKKRQPASKREQANSGAKHQSFVSSYPPSTTGTPGRTTRPSKKKKKTGLIRFLLVAVLIAAVVVGVYFLTALSALKPYDNTFFPNVYVNGINLEGKTVTEAKQLVYANAQSFIDQFSIRLTYNGEVYREITSGDLNISFDSKEIDEQLYQAWLVGHHGYVWERKKVLDQSLKEETYFTGGSLQKSTTIIDQVLEQMQQDFYVEPTNAAFSFTPGSKDTFSSQEEKAGRSINPLPVQEAIFDKLENMQSGDIALEPYINTVSAEVALDSLQNNVVLRAAYETPIRMRTKTTELQYNSKNRLHNIKLSMEAINNGLVNGIPNGGTFSFNDIVGKRTEDAGYQEAIEYVYGREEWGIGGGVCQTSTTIYMAAIHAGMTITERHAHSIEVGYQPVKGRDATVYWEHDNRKLDLSFVNNTGATIYIVGKVLDGKDGDKICRVEIYGAPMNGISYDIRTEEEPILPPEGIKTIKDKEHKYVTYTDEEPHFIPAQEGIKVKRYLITYEDGIEIKADYLGFDTYKAKQAVEYIGTEKRVFE